MATAGAATSTPSPAGTYSITYALTVGGGGNGETLLIKPNGALTFQASTCKGFWTISGDQFAFETGPCSGMSYVFEGSLTVDGSTKTLGPGTFTVATKTPVGRHLDQGTWSATTAGS